MQIIVIQIHGERNDKKQRIRRKKEKKGKKRRLAVSKCNNNYTIALSAKCSFQFECFDGIDEFSIQCQTHPEVGNSCGYEEI